MFWTAFDDVMTCGPTDHDSTLIPITWLGQLPFHHYLYTLPLYPDHRPLSLPPQTPRIPLVPVSSSEVCPFRRVTCVSVRQAHEKGVKG